MKQNAKTLPFALSLLAAALLAAAAAQAAPPSAPPASLSGSEPDGAFAVDADGRFVPDAGARRLFDYFLTASGEESPAMIRARVSAEAHLRLAAPAAREAERLFASYLTYREEARALPAPAAGSGSLEDAASRLQALRREVFGEAVARAVFGEEEELDAATLRALARGGSAATVHESLPRRVQAANEEALLPLRSQEREDGLRSAGAAPATVQELRVASFGPEAAVRLAALDREQADFRERLLSYRAARLGLLADASLSPERKASGVSELRAARFAGGELLRVSALDRIDGLESDPATR